MGNATDKNKDQLAKEAYRIELGGKSLSRSRPRGTRSVYGVETLVQLLRRHDGALWLPEGTIEDWPDLELRHIYWDDAHHLDRLDELKKAVRQAAFFKINGFAIKLKGISSSKAPPRLWNHRPSLPPSSRNSPITGCATTFRSYPIWMGRLTSRSS